MNEHYFLAKVRRVVDGDTIDLKVELGWETFKNIRVRLYGVNTPEVRTKDLIEKAAGLEASNWVKSVAQKGSMVKIQTMSYGKFGRTLAKVYILKDDKSVDFCINEKLIELGFAEEYMI